MKVVQHGRQYAVNIRKTSNKGWGMSVNIFVQRSTVPLTRRIGIFAGGRRIPKGAFIGIYAGEILTENEGEERGE